MVNFQVEFQADVVAKLKKSSFVCSRVKRVIRERLRGTGRETPNDLRAFVPVLSLTEQRYFISAREGRRSNSINTKDNWFGVFGPRDIRG